MMRENPPKCLSETKNERESGCRNKKCQIHNIDTVYADPQITKTATRKGRKEPRTLESFHREAVERVNLLCRISWDVFATTTAIGSPLGGPIRTVA